MGIQQVQGMVRVDMMLQREGDMEVQVGVEGEEAIVVRKGFEMFWGRRNGILGEGRRRVRRGILN
jgi:hypothetical protein